MTVTYTAEVATCPKFGSFIKLLARWRGSIYKLIWMDLVLFLVLYYSIHLIYYNFINANGYKGTFESIVVFCASYLSLIPLSFVLGFYVNLVMYRWWEQYITIPWPDSVALFVSTCVHGQDEGGRLMRRTIMRYVCLCLTIIFTMISPGVKKRFPKMKHLVDAGLLLENERQIFEKLDQSFPKYPKHWMPIIWAASVVTRARKEGRIRDDFAVKTIIDELNDFRGRCGTLLYYDFISIPLVYTQVVTIAVYSFFVCSLLAHQWTEKKKDTFEEWDFYYPVFITLEFFFYMGWLKVAETLINPFGEDDDDFEVNWMIDRNLQVSYLIVDEMHQEHPELVRDQYWDEVYPNELPYVSEATREKPPEPSTAKYDLEDLPKPTASRLPSTANSVVMNGKPGSSLLSVLSHRSQRFSEAFQRFLYNAEDETSSIKSDVENSIPHSPSETENIEHITAYTYDDQGELESPVDNEDHIEIPILEPITEEIERVSEEFSEEEMQGFEEEDNKTETQTSYESDSDSDPFERLRIERQQQRLQRMNDYLERHFGSSFRLVSQFLDTPVSKFKPPAEQGIYNKEPAPYLSADFIKFDVNSPSSLYDLENDESLLKAKISNATAIENASSLSIPLSKTAIDDQINQDEMLIQFEDKKNSNHSNLATTECNFPLESILIQERNVEEIKQLQAIECLSQLPLQPVEFKQISPTTSQTRRSVQNSKVSVTPTEQEPQFLTLPQVSSSGTFTQNLSSAAGHEVLIPENALHKSQENIFGEVSLLTFLQLPPPQTFRTSLASAELPVATQSVSLASELSSTSTNISQGLGLRPGNQNVDPNLNESNEISISFSEKEKSVVETQSSALSSIKQITPSAKEPDRLLESKATSPLGSAVTVSTQSSVGDRQIPNSD